MQIALYGVRGGFRQKRGEQYSGRGGGEDTVLTMAAGLGTLLFVDIVMQAC